ncbi:MAG: nucleotidyltransferase family protein, partial [Armatimonadetes bacterium]|nr:nucleotidyltransferase family protein [Armatimonadota bacterium]
MPEHPRALSGEAGALLTAKRDEVLRIAARYGAHNVRVFGSAARGDDREDSDIDLLIDLDPGRSLLDLAGLMLDLEELLGRRVDVGMARALKERYRDRVLADAVPL